MVIRFDNMWISVPSLLVPILFVVILMILIRIWTFSSPRWSRPIPSYSLHVMKDLPGHSTVDSYPTVAVRQSIGPPPRYAAPKGLGGASNISADSSVFGATAPLSKGYEINQPERMYYYEPGSRGVPQSIRRPEREKYSADVTDSTFDQDSQSTVMSIKKEPLSTDFL